MIKVYKADSKEYKALNYIASYLTMTAALGEENYVYKVEDIYYDFGAGLMWSTIVAHGKYEYQILYPRQHKQICEAESIGELNLIAIKLWYDRIK